MSYDIKLIDFKTTDIENNESCYGKCNYYFN